MKPAELNMLLNRYGVHRQAWRAELISTMRRTVTFAQLRAFGYGAIFGTFLFWVAQKP